MSKIMIIGTQGSGKTCYFYSMLQKMFIGINGFTLSTRDGGQYQKLRDAILRLGDTKLSLKDRCPAQSTTVENYSLELQYNYKLLDTLEWVDYPGEHVSQQDSDFIELVRSANCLLVCVDGSQLKIDEDDLEARQEEAEELEEFEPQAFEAELSRCPEELVEHYGKHRCLALMKHLEDVAYDFQQGANSEGFSGAGLDLCNALNFAESDSSNQLPPVCIMITKYDLVPKELKHPETLKKFAEICFPVLFRKGDQGKNRIVTICPVSLGTDFEMGGKLRPRNVERPICLGTYLSMYARVMQEVENHRNKLKSDSEALKRYHDRNVFGKWWNGRPDVMSEEERQNTEAMLQSKTDDLGELLKLLKVLPLYINGERQNWPE